MAVVVKDVHYETGSLNSVEWWGRQSNGRQGPNPHKQDAILLTGFIRFGSK